MNISTWAASLVCASGLCVSVAAAQTVTPIADLPNGQKASVSDMSGDGSTLVARTDTGIFRWRNGTWQSLGTVIGKTPTTVQASRTGDFVFSTMRGIGLPTQDRVHVYRGGAWSNAASSVDTFESHVAKFISADGSRLIADQFGVDFTRQRVFNWNGANYVEQSVAAAYPSAQNLNPPGSDLDEQSWFGMSNDGLTAMASLIGPVGGGTAARFGQSAVSFSRPSSVTPGPFFFQEFSRGQSLSGDGNVIYGVYTWSGAGANGAGNGQASFRWSAATGTTLLPSFELGTTEVSDNGDIWVMSDGGVYSHTAGNFLTASQFLSANAVDFAAWTNLRITQVSGDGLMLSGLGSFNNGSQIVSDQAWIVSIPTPGATGVAVIALLAGARRRR
jgi:hypothetical protein